MITDSEIRDLRAYRHNVAAVKREIAEKIAAAEVNEIAFADAQIIIDRFLDEVTACVVCGGTKTFTFGREVEISTVDSHNYDAKRFIPEGSTGPCPLCGDLGKDPEFYVWHCIHGDNDRDCQHGQSAGNGERKRHADCGYRIMLRPKVPGGTNT